MVDIKNINDNILANRWKERYAKQTEDIKQKLDKLAEAKINDYQLQVIKRKKIYPQIGDIFKVNPTGDIILYGVVINNHISNINGDDLLVVLIFKEKLNVMKIKENSFCNDDLLIPPQIVGKEYWTRGYFYNEDFMVIAKSFNYGFYDIFDKVYLDEYGNILKNEPQMLGTYAVATLSGIARKINQELIIEGIL